MTTWVLLRGLARESRHWGGFAHALRQALPPGDRVVLLDLPGSGARHRETAPWTVEEIVRSVRDDLARRAVAAPFVLVALSLGGMVALQWAVSDPGSVRGCVLVNTSVRGWSPPWQRLRPGALLKLLCLPGHDLLARERRILALTSNDPRAMGLAPAWADYARSAPVRPGNVLRQLVAAFRFRAPRARPAVPVLLIASQQDRLVSVRCSRAIARAWSVQLSEHPRAGHDLPLDDPAWLAERIASWAATLDGEDGPPLRSAGAPVPPRTPR